MTTPLQKAAQALLDCDETGPIRKRFADLRKALDAEIAQTETVTRNLRVTEQAVEPVAWVRFARKKPTVTSLSFFSDLTPLQKAHGFVSTPLCHCHPPQPQATTAVPEGYVLVPIEPTDEELSKGVRAMRLFVTKNSLIDFSLGYKAMLAAAREYLATETKHRGEITFGGCPACGKQSCIASSCTTNKPAIQSLTPQDATELRSAGVTGEVVRVLAFNDRPKAAPNGDRAELIAELRSRIVGDPFPLMDRAADMLEADAQQAKPYDQQSMELCDTCGWKGIFPGEPCLVCAQQAKRVPMRDSEIYAIARLHPRVCTLVPHLEVRDFARAIEAHRGIMPADKPTGWSAA